MKSTRSECNERGKQNSLFRLHHIVSKRTHALIRTGHATHLDSVVALREMPCLLLLLLGHQVRLVFCEASTDGAGLLLAEVEGEVLLALVEDAELCALIGVDDCEAAGDGLADVVAVRYTCQYMTSCSIRSSLLSLHALAHVSILRCHRYTHILLNLDEAPPAIFCVRNCTSSCFNSSSCFDRSSLFFPQSWAALTFPVDDCQETKC
jgi:hypothetical protein